MPDSEDQLRRALNERIFSESHTLEFKRGVGVGPKANRELARDLAQFAIDGGCLAIGVAELADEQGYDLAPVEIEGLCERIDQVARSVIDPPLQPRFEVLHSTEPGRGYVLVHVPPSPQAPHAVDGRFYGRGDRTKHILAAAEVEAIVRRRLEEQRAVEDVLDAWVARDPIPPDVRQGGHLFVVATPVTGGPGMLFEAIRDDEKGDRPQDVARMLIAGRASQRWEGSTYGGLFAPDIPEYTSSAERRPDGWGFHSVEFQSGRLLRNAGSLDEEGTLDIEVTEDGETRLFCGRAATRRDDHGPGLIFEILILGLTKRILFMASNVADLAGYLGSWDIAVAVNGIQGMVSYRLDSGFFGRGRAVPYAADKYRAQIRVTLEQLERESDVDHVVEQLLGRLNRSVNGGVVDPPRLAEVSA